MIEKPTEPVKPIHPKHRKELFHLEPIAMIALLNDYGVFLSELVDRYSPPEDYFLKMANVRDYFPTVFKKTLIDPELYRQAEIQYLQDIEQYQRDMAQYVSDIEGYVQLKLAEGS